MYVLFMTRSLLLIFGGSTFIVVSRGDDGS
jgi:hypothetical protein